MRRGRENNWLALSKIPSNRCGVSAGCRPRPGEMEEINRTEDQSRAKGRRTDVTNPIFFLKEQRTVKSFGLMDLVLQYQSFCQHWEIFHLELMLFGRNRGKKKEEKNQHFLPFCRGKKACSGRPLASQGQAALGRSWGSTARPES